MDGQHRPHQGQAQPNSPCEKRDEGAGRVQATVQYVPPPWPLGFSASLGAFTEAEEVLVNKMVVNESI